MVNKQKLEGLIAAPFTPMTADGALNLAAVEPYADLLAASGVKGVFICGTTGDLDSEGWYAVAGWRVTRTLLPAVRYDTFLEDCSRGSSRQTNYTAGLTWQPVKYLRCQLNYTYEDYASRAAANRNVVSLMLSGIF